jgi:hypothetical protein
VALVFEALPNGAVGEYQLQAAIAAVHDEAATADQTDWPQILALYGLLERNTGNPMVMLNRAVAAEVVDGPAAGLRLLAGLDKRLPGHPRLDAVPPYMRRRLIACSPAGSPRLRTLTPAGVRTARWPHAVPHTDRSGPRRPDPIGRRLGAGDAGVLVMRQPRSVCQITEPQTLPCLRSP